MLSDILDLRAPPEVVEALRHGKRCGGYIRGYCPYCDPHHDHRGKLSLSAGMPFGKPWWGCHRCHAEEDVKAARQLARLRIENFSGTKQRTKAQQSARAIEIFEQTRPIHTDDAVDRYLRETRRLVPSSYAWPSDLRIGSLRYYLDDKRWTGPWPTMVAAVRNSAGLIVAIHRTFLFVSTEHGVLKLSDPRVPDKHRVSDAKKAQGPIEACAIRLGIDSDAIGLTEGIESAFGLAMATNLVCWAAISSEGMKQFRPPEFVRKIVIGFDIDKKVRLRNGKTKTAGIEAAHSLRTRLLEEVRRSGRSLSVEMLTPPLGCNDWADHPLLRTSK